MKREWLIVLLLAALPSCKDFGEVPRTNVNLLTDAELFSHITVTEPFHRYTLFPNADSVTSGTLNGSNAHQPEVRVSLNATAYSALNSGRLPVGTTFPDGSIIFKLVRIPSQPTVFAVMMKDPSGSFAGNGWLWAEYDVNGAVLFSIERRGVGCISCHSREQGPQNDLVRTFERQRP